MKINKQTPSWEGKKIKKSLSNLGEKSFTPHEE